MDRESLALLLGQGLSVEEIAKRFGKHPSTVSYWRAKHGLEAVDRQPPTVGRGIDRERLQPLVEAGMTVAEMAKELAVCTSTVRRWLLRHELRTNRTRGSMGKREAKDAGLVQAMFICRHHGETEFVLEGRGYYRCRRCRNDGIVNHRRKLKEQMVAEAGGRCVICGYDRCVAALEFHHLDPSEKRLGIAAGGLTLSLDSLRAEVAKCVLLCSNCHGEVERGIAALPVESSRGIDHQQARSQSTNTP